MNPELIKFKFQLTMNRIQALSYSLSENQTSGLKGNYSEQRSQNKLDWFKHNGWGYKDSEFLLENDGSVILTGKRYQFAGQKLPKFKEWAERVTGLDVNVRTPAQEEIPINAPTLNEEFLKDCEGKFNEVSHDKAQRILHSHGHSMQEVFALRYGQLERCVDCVVFINSHDQAVLLVELAVKHNVVLIPYGGGTNVTWALKCRKDEERMIVSVDVNRMNHVKWVDRKNMSALVECGIIGKDMEKELARYGVLCGHEPDSFEFSSLGGWISTRASGMKKNRYGNIEDIVLQIRVVTPTGVYNRTLDYPRISSGPDLNQLILGSEGTLGIITEAVIKVRPLPQVQIFDSIIFHNFALGTQFMYDVAQTRVWPASLRLFGIALKTAPKDKTHELIDRAKKYFVTQILKFNPDEMSLATVVFEGNKEEVAYQQKVIYELSKKYYGYRAGPENGQRGYFLTFVIAYLRDYGFQFCYIAESFETSCAWKSVSTLCENVLLLFQQIKQVKNRVANECRKHKVRKEPFISFRVTQVYDTGAAVYVYFGFQYEGITDPVSVYSQIEDAAREEIMNNGGSISHHHGVGKLRKQFLERSIGSTGISFLNKIKKEIDPMNIFANGNLV